MSNMSNRAPTDDGLNINWNEIQFLSGSEFRQMAPSILQLEITRLGKCIRSCPEGSDFNTGLVRARFELTQFIACLKRAQKDSLQRICVPHLQVAIMNLSIQPTDLDLQTKETCRYVLDRLTYVHHRIRLIY